MPSRPLEERFWEKVDKNGSIHPHMLSLGRCWMWTASTRSGYGGIAEGAPSKKILGAHRVSYEMHHGSIISNLEVQHSCNNPRCVNPAHLSQDTPLVNAQYSVEQGRRPCHENHKNAKLTEEQVAEIRRNYVKNSRTHGQPALAKRFGVSHATIGYIVREESWKAVPA